MNVWKESLKLFGIQLVVSVVVAILDLVIDYFTGRELPNSITFLGALFAAQFYAMRRYQKHQDDLKGRVGGLSWRSALWNVLVVVLAVAGATAVLPEGERPLDLIQALDLPSFAWVIICLIGIGGAYGITAGGLKMGVSLAKKAEAKQLKKASTR